MVAPAGAAVVVDGNQPRGPGDQDVAFLHHLARQRLLHRLSRFHASSGKLPARNIGVANEEDAVPVRVMHKATHSERHGAPHQEIKMKQAGPQTVPSRLPERLLRIAAAHGRIHVWKAASASRKEKQCSVSRIFPMSIPAPCPMYPIAISPPSASWVT